MHVVFEVGIKCPGTKTKSEHKARTKAPKKEKCPDCGTRKSDREDLKYTTSENQFGFNYERGYEYSYDYRYGDWSPWGGSYSAAGSAKLSQDYTQTTRNAAYKEKHISDTRKTVVNDTKAYAEKTLDAVDEAHATIRDTYDAVKEARLAIQKTQDAMRDGHAEQMHKQKECAADIARLRQLVEDEAKKREKERRVKETIQYAQSQGLLQTQAQATAHALAQALLDQDRRQRDRTPRSDSPTPEATSSQARRQGRHARVDEEREAEGYRGGPRPEDVKHRQQRRDSHFRRPRSEDVHRDDVVEEPPYSTYSYEEYAIGRGVTHRQPPRQGRSGRGSGNAKGWDY